MRDGMSLDHTFTLVPSADRLRVVVRDVRTGAIGAVGVSRQHLQAIVPYGVRRDARSAQQPAAEAHDEQGEPRRHRHPVVPVGGCHGPAEACRTANRRRGADCPENEIQREDEPLGPDFAGLRTAMKTAVDQCRPESRPARAALCAGICDLAAPPCQHASGERDSVHGAANHASRPRYQPTLVTACGTRRGSRRAPSTRPSRVER